MKKLVLFFVFIVLSLKGFSQVGINTTTPNAQLDIRSSNQATPSNTDGILIPKIDAFPATNPTAAQNGMMVYLTTATGSNQPGFYYWDNATLSWQAVSKTDDDWYEVGSVNVPNAITDNMYHIGNVAIGKSTTTAKLDIEQTNSNTYSVRVRHSNPPNGLSSSAMDNQIISNQLSGVITGVNNFVNANNSVIGYGVYNNMQGNTDDEMVGVGNIFLNSGTNLRTGFRNSFNSGTGSSYGLFNSFNQPSFSSQSGVTNNFYNTAGSGMIMGIDNYFSGSGDGAPLIGVNNAFSTTTNSNIFGTNINIFSSSTGTGLKYGVYSFIDAAAGGTHYGVFSQATKSTSYSGYFLGRFAIGSTLSNTYIMPASRGTNGQIMQTDGTGNVTWQNPSAVIGNVAWGLSGNSGTNATFNFIGTTDNQDIVFKRDGIISGRVGTISTSFGLFSSMANPNKVICAFGREALSVNTEDYNNAFGCYALENNTTGGLNNAFGFRALSSCVTGSYNSAFGDSSLENATGMTNSGFGAYTLKNTTSGIGNTAIGTFSSELNVSGSYNIAIGHSSLRNNTVGSRNIAIGYAAGMNELGSDKLYIENSNSATPLIYGEFDTDILRSNSQRFFVNDPTVNGVQMLLKNSDRYTHFVDANIDFGATTGNFLMATAETNSETAGIRGDGDNVSIWSPGDGGRQLRILDEDAWVDNNGNPYDNAAEVAYIANNGQYFQVSDRNKKENIQKIQNALTKLVQISGYTYQYKLKSAEIEKGEKPTVSSGFLAQEIEQVLPEAVQKNESGEYFVDYAAITPLLLEAIKEQNTKIQSLEERLKILEEKGSK